MDKAALPVATARTVVITGASSGIGRCTAMEFARRGWRVGLIARGPRALAATAAAVEAAGGIAAIGVADVSDSAALAQAAAAIADRLGPADVWINNAGNGVYGPFASVPDGEFDRVTAVTYGGTVHGTRIALAQMTPRDAGTIVNVCSAIAFHGMPLMSSYAGAKAAVRGFGQAVRAELAIQGSRIRISTVFPPAANTPFFSHATSHMRHPSRPAPPVYQPDIVAAGIYLAATTGRAEVVISGTAAAFGLVSRLSPSFVALLMRHMHFDKQMTRDPAASLLLKPTLFAPHDRPGSTHGPFGGNARRRSLQLWLAQRRARCWAALAGLSRLSAARFRPRHAPAIPHPAPVGLAPLDGASSDIGR